MNRKERKAKREEEERIEQQMNTALECYLLEMMRSVASGVRTPEGAVVELLSDGIGFIEPD